MQKLVQIAHMVVRFLVGTGSPVTLLREDNNRLLGSFPVTSERLRLSGFGRVNVRPKSSFSTDIDIDKSIVSTNVYVSNFAHISHRIILGRNITCQVTLTYEDISLSTTTADIFINLINICDDLSEIDFAHITGRTCCDEVGKFIQNYRPTKSKSTVP